MLPPDFVCGELTLVLGVRLHEVGTGANVGRVLALGDELEVQGIAAGLDAIGRRVLSAINAALGSASLAISADGAIPSVALVAVGSARELVSPAPVGVNGDGTVDSAAAAASSALGPGQGGVGLGGEGADLLRSSRRHKGGEGGELSGEHCA